MRRADHLYRAAIALSRRRQLARLVENLEMMVSVKPRNADEAVHQEQAIADLMQRNTATRDSQPTV